MPSETHDRRTFQPRHPESAEANGVNPDPPGRSPSEVDDSALRAEREHPTHADGDESNG